jgi:hypothetical protein
MNVRPWSDIPGGAKSAESSLKLPWTLPNRHRCGSSRRQESRGIGIFEGKRNASTTAI